MEPPLSIPWHLFRWASGVQDRQLPLWVKKRLSVVLLARSAPEGEADEIGAKADIGAKPPRTASESH